MAVFKNISPQNFIDEVWQKKPFVFEQSFPDIAELTDGNDLAGLACENDVESRIISGHDLNGAWQCQQGPFTSKDFSKLAETNWTLLVQGLDQWNDRAKQILEQFNFLPKWRLEDIMASYAPIGGSVGPHFDYYDVFLIQASGTREWQLGQQCDHNSALQDNEQVKLLAEFDCQQRHQIHAGDMIYIPAGLAHWGTATTDDCITLSVGFRAPSQNEILIQSLELLIEKLSNQEHSDRYKDSPESIDDNPYKINQHIQKSLPTVQSQTDTSLTEQAFGQLVTEQRYFTDDGELEDWDVKKLAQALEGNPRCELIHDPSSRFAFTENYLFVNREAFKVSEPFSKMLCNGLIERELNASELRVLLDLLSEGSVQIKG
jgi:50S ribosomal protein L16 3-hydroxylase|tara:strand:- start:176636 stop:177757 length:1122 start_codon:yes stop_codon:yes gene_type:complete